MAASSGIPGLRLAFVAIAIPFAAYFGILGLMIAFPSFQTHAFYLHRVTLTWFKDINAPETFGFLHNQVVPFSIKTKDDIALHAWHILPFGIYQRNEQTLLSEPSGFVHNVESRHAFKLLRDDPEARLVISFHGTSGTIASRWRPDGYRAIYSAAPEKIHVLAIEYRGYGLSDGTPSEEGLLLDAIATADWAMNVAGIPPSRIVLFAQSLGTAVALSLSEHLARQPTPVVFSGMVLISSFSDVETLVATYRIGGVIPVLSPLKRLPALLDFFASFLTSTWLSKDRIATL